jgi:hypothetical protein
MPPLKSFNANFESVVKLYNFFTILPFEMSTIFKLIFCWPFNEKVKFEELRIGLGLN